MYHFSCDGGNQADTLELNARVSRNSKETFSYDIAAFCTMTCIFQHS